MPVIGKEDKGGRRKRRRRTKKRVRKIGRGGNRISRKYLKPHSGGRRRNKRDREGQVRLRYGAGEEGEAVTPEKNHLVPMKGVIGGMTEMWTLTWDDGEFCGVRGGGQEVQISNTRQTWKSCM